ncbi:MAG: hypothetical protein Q8S57_07970 [Methanoregula sp.]|nr:hypothetical protein [Methanoregula sp.]
MGISSFFLFWDLPPTLSPPACHALISWPLPSECSEPMQKMQLDEVILRWKKTTRALKIYEQEYGKKLTDCLEKRTDAELIHFHDPVEAAAFFCLVELMKTKSVQYSSGNYPQSP